MSAMTFLLGMLSPRTNVKGMIAGYVGGMIPLVCSLIGMFFIPRHKSFYNSTGRVFSRINCWWHSSSVNNIGSEMTLKTRKSTKCGHVWGQWIAEHYNKFYNDVDNSCWDNFTCNRPRWRLSILACYILGFTTFPGFCCECIYNYICLTGILYHRNISIINLVPIKVTRTAVRS